MHVCGVNNGHGFIRRTGEAIRDLNPSYTDIQLWAVLRERNFGDLEGKTIDNMLNAVRGLNKADLAAWGPPNGETGLQFRSGIKLYAKSPNRKTCFTNALI